MKIVDRDALKDWEAHKKNIEQATAIEIEEDYLTKKTRIDALLKDVEAFAKYYFPHYCQTDFGDFQLRFLKKAIKHKRFFGVNEWSRDHAKSVITDIILVLFLKQTKQMRNLLLCSHNETNACELLKPLKLEFENNLRIIHDFGTQVNPGDWTDGKFVTLDGCSFRAIGAGQNPRGARSQEARPDIILVDDIDSEELCRNPKRLDELWEWVTGALQGCFSIQGNRRFIIVGNRIAKDSVIVRAIPLADHHEQINILRIETIDHDYIEGIKTDIENAETPSDNRIWQECLKYAQGGYKPTWSERFTIFDCVYAITKMGYRMSQREYFNNPLVEGKVFKKDWWQFKKLPPLKSYKYLVSYLDPGFKNTATSDSKCQVLIGMLNGEFHIRKVFCGKGSVEDMIGWGYATDEFVKRNGGTYRFKMEEVFLQSLLYKDYAAASIKKGYPLPVSGDTRKKPDKDARIEAMSGFFERGAIYVDEDIKDDHHFIAFMEQFHNFEPGVKTLKDGPDAMEGCLHILQQSISLSADVYNGNYLQNKKRV